jgi:hypothetical protein
MRVFVIVVLLMAAGPGLLWSQKRYINHEVFSLDSVALIRFDLFGNYEVVQWEGSSLMIKTEVLLYNGSEAILQDYLKNNRYAYRAVRTATELLLSSVDKQRINVRTSRGECYESVDTVIYIPAVFEPTDDQQWTRKPSSD